MPPSEHQLCCAVALPSGLPIRFLQIRQKGRRLPPENEITAQLHHAVFTARAYATENCSSSMQTSANGAVFQRAGDPQFATVFLKSYGWHTGTGRCC
ncbi:hypothetical protein KCP69_05115 [Salmonella enterica subsp. enterica]|nr:hypothetical protein KCP69_05115 [Salmonella enterica subsp. enterica]